MNLSIVMMKQGAICVVISASRDNWKSAKADTIHYYRYGVLRAERAEGGKRKESNHAAAK